MKYIYEDDALRALRFLAAKNRQQPVKNILKVYREHISSVRRGINVADMLTSFSHGPKALVAVNRMHMPYHYAITKHGRDFLKRIDMGEEYRATLKKYCCT